MYKIGMIAMSGIRCNDQELLDLGLNLPGFVERSTLIASLPSLGLLTLAGMVPEGFSVDYLEISDMNEAHQDLSRFDLVAISSFTAKIKDAYRLARYCRERSIFVILGGLHVTVMPDEALQYADTVILGEAESLWPTFLSDFKQGKPRRVYDCRSLSFDLADAPMPAFELLAPEKYNRLTIQTQRGCPWKCDFCASSILLTNRYKQKPVDKVIQELHKIKTIWSDPFIEFADDNTFVNKKYGKALVRALIPEKIRWFTETDISVGEDDELLALMAQSGCAQLLIGLESPVKTVLDSLEITANWKQKQFDRYINNIKNIQRHGITVNGCFILGIDGADSTYFDKVFEFVERSQLFEVQITIMTPFPGTPLYERYIKSGRIIEPGAWEKCTLFDINFKPEYMSVDELRQGLIDLGAKIYAPEKIKARRKHFFRQKKRKLVDSHNVS